MQNLTLTKPTTRGKQPAVVHADLQSALFPYAERNNIGDLANALSALSEAERVIHNQQERIRQLEDLALTDELTGLLNRRGFMTALQRELNFARRDQNAKGILVMIDLDGFKSINDLWGHCAGDDYLQVVAHTLLSEVRAHDIVARIGGDEFAILFTRMDMETGHARVKKLEQSFNSRIMHWRDKILPLRASFGLSSYDGSETHQEIMTAADLKLYAHKARKSMKTPEKVTSP